MKPKSSTRKDLLEDQLEQGLINQEYYNHQVEALDEDLDKKKAEITLKQAKREKSCRHIQCNHQYCRRNRSFLSKRNRIFYDYWSCRCTANCRHRFHPSAPSNKKGTNKADLLT